MKLIARPTRVKAAGNKPKIIEEFVGKVNTRTPELSIARMRSPAGWVEPGQLPEFDEYTLVLKGRLVAQFEKKTVKLTAGQAVIAGKGEWVRYSTPVATEYLSVCLPAFSPQLVHRDSE